VRKKESIRQPEHRHTIEGKGVGVILLVEEAEGMNDRGQVGLDGLLKCGTDGRVRESGEAVEGVDFFYCGWSLLCHGTAERKGG
jgi:hypothetical protein